MIIRKYLVDNINEALFRIKHELGDDAYIISQKMVRQPGVKGFFSNKKLEVTVGLINKEEQESKYLANGNVSKESVNLSSINSNSQNVQQNFPQNNLNSGVFNLGDVVSQPQNDIYQSVYQQNDKSKSMSYYNKLFEEKQKMFDNLEKEQSPIINSNNVVSNKNDFSKMVNTYLDKSQFKNSKVDNFNRSSIIDLNLEQPSEQYFQNNNFDKDKIYSKDEILNKSLKSEEKTIESYDDLKKDIFEIKNMVTGLMNKNVNRQTDSTILDEILYRQGICRELCNEIKLNCMLSDEELKDVVAVKKYLRGIFSNIIRVSNEDLSNRIVVVGPTGSGKTTTVAKLAGMLNLNLGKKVGLVSIDTFRVGAVEQLKIYSEIMNIPYKFATCLNDMRTVFDDMKFCDVVLIDTIGRGNKNIIQLNELSMFVQSIQLNEVSLVVSAGMRYQDVDLFINSIKGIKFKNVIVTKVDETNSFGMFVNICYKNSLPISFVTMGQDVPVDIKKANKKEILDMILGEEELWLHIKQIY